MAAVDRIPTARARAGARGQSENSTQKRPRASLRPKLRDARSMVNRMLAGEARKAAREVIAGRGTLADLAKVAAALEVPAWTLLIEDLHEHPELCRAGGVKGLEMVVRDYLASDPTRRGEIEVVARASAALSRVRA